jgi:hypothetical protein
MATGVLGEAHERWMVAVATAQHSRGLILQSRALIHASRVILDLPPGRGRIVGGSDGDASTGPSPSQRLPLGQAVRREDRADIGVVVGILLRPPETLLVRWFDGVTFEAMEDLVEVGQPVSRNGRSGAARHAPGRWPHSVEGTEPPHPARC